MEKIVGRVKTVQTTLAQLAKLTVSIYEAHTGVEEASTTVITDGKLVSPGYYAFVDHLDGNPHRGNAAYRTSDVKKVSGATYLYRRESGNRGNTSVWCEETLYYTGDLWTTLTTIKGADWVAATKKERQDRTANYTRMKSWCQSHKIEIPDGTPYSTLASRYNDANVMSQHLHTKAVAALLKANIGWLTEELDAKLSLVRETVYPDSLFRELSDVKSGHVAQALLEKWALDISYASIPRLQAYSKFILWVREMN